MINDPTTKLVFSYSIPNKTKYTRDTVLQFVASPHYDMESSSNKTLNVNLTFGVTHSASARYYVFIGEDKVEHMGIADHHWKQGKTYLNQLQLSIDGDEFGADLIEGFIALGQFLKVNKQQILDLSD